MSERDEITERLARTQIALDEAQEEFDIAAADMDAFNAARTAGEATNEIAPPA